MNAHNIPELMQALGQHAKSASAAMAKASAAHKSAALKELALLLRQETAALVQANQEDLNRAKSNGLDGPMLDRLKLSASARFDARMVF
jgi:glutamate-5-semialdehyde dehydrogenase